MPIDPRIAMGFQSPQFEQPINVMGNFLKLKSMQQQNALAEQQMAELERQRSQNAFLNQAYSEAIDPQTGALDYNKLIGATARGGYGSLAPGLLKSKLETDEQTAKTRSAEIKLFGDALGARRQVLGMIQTPEQFRAWHEGNHTDPVVGPMLDRMGIKPEDSRATIVARLEKGELQNLIAESSMSMEEMIKNVKNVDVGDAVVGVMPTGAELWRKRKMLSPDEQGRIDREFNPNKVAHVTTDNQGNVYFWNAQGGEVNPGAGVGAGKPSAQVERDRIARRDLKTNLDTAITELTAALKPDGLLSRATGSGFGSGIDKASAAVGRATEGSVAIGQLQPIFDLVLKLVPRFEGPQSDADTKSYREAAGNLANPSTPNPVKKAAATTILRLMKSRRNQFGVKDETGNVVTGEQAAAGGDDLDALVERHRTK